VVLILVIRFAPRGLVGAIADVRDRFARRLLRQPATGEAARG